MKEGDGKPKDDTMELHKAFIYTDGYQKAISDILEYLADKK